MKRLNEKLVSLRGIKLLWFITFLLFAGCSNSQKQTQDSVSESAIPFVSTEIDHAIGFDIVYHDQWKEVLLFRHYNDFVDTIKYALYLNGAQVPKEFEPSNRIEIPVERVASMSTTHLSMFSFLDAQSSLKAIEGKKYVSAQEIKNGVDNGEIVELSPAGEMNLEVAVATNLDVVLGVGYPNLPNEAYQNLENLGIPVLLNADWQEKTLLGRAEWVKLLAALLNKEEVVNQAFAQLELRYEKVAKKLGQVESNAPNVITGLAQGGVWYVAGGRSFAYYLLELAGVTYPWARDESTGSVRLSIETVYEEGLKADFWLVPSVAKTLQELEDADSRYLDFKAVKNNKVFNIYGRFTEGGGNDFYESAVMNPDIVLKDIGKIFHPSHFPEHELYYYNQLK